MYECVRCRAGFAACNIKSGKTVLQFELDAKYQHVIPDLAAITGKPLPLGEPVEDAGPDEEPAEGGEPGEELSEADETDGQTDAAGPDEWLDEEER